MRVYLTYAIASMGVISLILALATGEIYSRFLLKNQQLIMRDFVANQTDALIGSLQEEVSDLGYSMQAEEIFKKALVEKSTTGIRSMLAKQFERHFADDGAIKLLGLAIFDKKIENAIQYFANPQVADTKVCSHFILHAQQGSERDKLKRKSGLCLIEGKPTFVILLPIGGLFPKGYLLIVTDLVTALTPLEKNINSPIKLLSANNRQFYASRQWSEYKTKDFLLAEYALEGSYKENVLIVKAAKNIRGLKRNLKKTQIIVAFAAVLITILTTAIAHLILKRTVVRPLAVLADQLQKVRNDKKYLGETVYIKGNKEITALAENFNLMSTELKNLYEALENTALTDPLTKLPNRLRLQLTLKSLIQLNKSREVSFAILIMDMDGFKKINDTLGHLAGDELLSEVGNRLRLVSRTTDFLSRLEKAPEGTQDDRVLARIGGDEFAGVFQRVRSYDEAMAVIDHLFQALSTPFLLDGCCYQIGMSIGVALFPQDGDDAETLMKHADMAMYRAKRGKLGYAFYAHENNSIQNTHVMQTEY